MKIKLGNSVWKPVLVVINPCKPTVVDAATNLMESYCTKATKNLTFNYRREYGVQKASHIFKILMIFSFSDVFLYKKKVKQNLTRGSVKQLCVIVQELTQRLKDSPFLRIFPIDPLQPNSFASPKHACWLSTCL